VRRWAGVARFGGIGDNLIAASVFPVLKRMGYMVDVISESPNHALYLHNPHVDKLSIKNPGEIPKGDLLAWQKWVESRAREYDLFLHASHAVEGRHAVFSAMSAFWWPVEYRRKLCAGNYLETMHDIMGVPHEFGPLYYASEEEQAHAALVKRQVGPRCLVWVVTGSRIDKVYPYASMAIARIIRELDIPVVVMGGPSDKEFSMVESIRDHVTRQNGSREGLHLAVPAQGGEKSWPLRSSLAFALGADLVVSPDTGPAWAVAFAPMPKLIMVSHASAENITKHWVNTTTLHADQQRVPCWPCHRLHDDVDTCWPNKENNGATCISDITVEVVVQTVAKLWAPVPAVGVAARPD
jgi:ADP-heptose:LPS heptosyltransferase